MPSILATLWTVVSRWGKRLNIQILKFHRPRFLNGARSLFPNSQTSFLLLSSLPGLSRADNETISTTPKPTQPNVLFIVADDLGGCLSMFESVHFILGRMERCILAQSEHPQPNSRAASRLRSPAGPVLRAAHLLPKQGRHDDRQVPVQGGKAAHVHQAPHANGHPGQRALDARLLQEGGLHDSRHWEMASRVLSPELYTNISRI